MKINEYRCGRGFVRVGDEVRLRPSRPGKRDGFTAKVRDIDADDSGAVTAVTVYGGKTGHPGAFRTVRPERVMRATAAR